MKRSFPVLIILIVSLAIPYNLYSQKETVQKGKDDNHLYGSIRLRAAAYKSAKEIQNGASRIGLFLKRSFSDDFYVFGRIELGANLVTTDVQFTPDAASQSDLLGSSGTGNRALAPRLGLAGVTYGDYGTLTIGKQWSVFSDISLWTNMFNVFGSGAIGTYTGGTDGGAMGTGRAEQALIYRNKIDIVKFGLQTQQQGLYGSNAFTGYAASAYVTLFDNLDIGAAINTASIPQEFYAYSESADREMIYAAAVRYSHQDIYAAFSISSFKKHGMIITDSSRYLYDGLGIELSVIYKITDDIHVLTGFNYISPENLKSEVNPDYRMLEYYLGGEYCFDSNTRVYTEALLNGSIDGIGKKGYNVLAFGIRYDFRFE